MAKVVWRAAKRRYRNLQRVDSGRFHGWQVKVKEKQVRLRYFWDKRHGGRVGALGAAVKYREALEARLPAPARIQSWNSRNRTGVVGLYRGVYQRKDGPCYYYAGTWVDEEWRTRSKSFSVEKYGKARARALAIRARRKAVRRILQERRRILA